MKELAVGCRTGHHSSCAADAATCSCFCHAMSLTDTQVLADVEAQLNQIGAMLAAAVARRSYLSLDGLQIVEHVARIVERQLLHIDEHRKLAERGAPELYAVASGWYPDDWFTAGIFTSVAAAKAGSPSTIVWQGIRDRAMVDRGIDYGPEGDAAVPYWIEAFPANVLAREL